MPWIEQGICKFVKARFSSSNLAFVCEHHGTLPVYWEFIIRPLASISFLNWAGYM